MINFKDVNSPDSVLDPRRWLGRLVRLPLRLIPRGAVLPILQGPGRGLRWIAGSYNHGCWLGSYEYEKQLAIRDLVRAGDVVYDVGAHVGFFTLILSRLVGPAGIVYSFEPVEENYAFLLRHLDLNGVTNVTAIRAAAGSATGLGRIQRGRDSSTGKLGGEQGVECQVLNLVEYIAERGLRTPTLMKIDIEGEEARVVPSVVDYAVATNTRLLISTHSEAITTSLADLLVDRGFQVTPLQWARKPGRRTLEAATLILAAT
jgi:FkbM family methyltransferase